MDVPVYLTAAIQKFFIRYSATISATLPWCRNHKRGCQVKERKKTIPAALERKACSLLDIRKSTGERIPYKCSNPIKKKCSSWSSHFLQCESQSFAWHKSWRKPGFISSAACKTASSYSSFPSRITDYFFTILIFLETYALNDFPFGPCYPLLLFSWWFHRGCSYAFTSLLQTKANPPHCENEQY